MAIDLSLVEETHALIAASRDGVLLDTNVLLLLLIGTVSEEQIERCSRLRGYSTGEFELLEFLLRDHRGFAITPHIATETWNLGENALNGAHQASFKKLFVEFLESARETWIPAERLVGESYFLHLGIADSGAARIRRRRPVVITDDVLLTVQLEKQGSKVVNFTRLRALI